MGRVPDGYVMLQIDSPFIKVAGPLYSRGSGADTAYGVLIEPHHINRHGKMQGGVLSLLADVSMGLTSAFHSGEFRSLRTINLSMDIISTASLGDWLFSKCEVLSFNQERVYTRSLIVSRTAVIARASAVFCPPR